MPIETLVSAPEPEDNRTPEEKWADHLTDINRDISAGGRRNQEMLARIATAGERLVLPPDTGQDNEGAVKGK